MVFIPGRNSMIYSQDEPMARGAGRTSDMVASYAPVVLPAAGRGENLQLRVSAPATGDRLPIIIFSHGNGQSLDGYGPLANYWASTGFLVLQPTHLDSRTIGLAQDDPRRADFWRFREHDLVQILDQIDVIEQMVPAINGRLDRTRIAAAGHSWGGQTASMLLGATHPDPASGAVVNIADDRVKAGVLFAVPGTGGNNLIDFAAKNFPFMNPDFSGMSTPTLVIAGDHDHGRMTTLGPEWWTEAYRYSLGDKCLFTVFGGEHSLGGIPGYEAAETTDENPERLTAVQRLSSAYLLSRLYHDDKIWSQAVIAVTESPHPQGTVNCK